ncbi:DUF7620 family protein [Rhodococcus aetherivorans]|uniref:DUF7620 family protein n=1 Tax=Rhodococcus aetherivorans TaxID=191292 RepID=UPI003CD039EC
MRWMWHRAEQEKQRLEATHQALERESEREKRVDEVIARVEAARRRNHFGESAMVAMRRRHA